MDLMATVCSLSGAVLPSDRVLDSHDLSPVLLGKGASSRESILYYRGTQLMAARLGPWKAHFITQSAYGGDKPETHDPPLLFHLEHDPSERHNIAQDHSEAIAAINKMVAEHRENLVVAKSQLGP
jgi:arylsulfatase A-like enzyme